MNKMVYITSLGHSGSTLLNLLIGRHPKMIGLGEVNNSIGKINKKQNMCTCGLSALECQIWGEVLKKEINDKYNSITDIYTDLFQLVHNKYGKDKIICDSSKNIEWFNKINKQVINNKVIFLVKDVRAYSHSLIRKNRKIVNKSLKHKLLNFKITHYYFWYQKKSRGHSHATASCLKQRQGHMGVLLRKRALRPCGEAWSVQLQAP